MKRYRTIGVEFDTRANMLTLEIRNEWDEKIKSVHGANKEAVRNELKTTFGTSFYEEKEKNFIEIGSYFPSIISFHNKFFTQVRVSFTMGGYYPALTGTTTLTERVLNHLIIKLRDDFKGTPEYKEVYNKGSFTDWDDVIRVLEAWKVLLPDTKPHLMQLKKLRHQYAAHFNNDTDTRDRELALDAIHAFQKFIKIQFGFFGKQPWFIPGTKGAFYTKKEWESHPFIQKIYLPNCALVGPNHKIASTLSGMAIQDETYPDKEITDDEFVALLSKK